MEMHMRRKKRRSRTLYRTEEMRRRKVVRCALRVENTEPLWTDATNYSRASQERVVVMDLDSENSERSGCSSG